MFLFIMFFMYNVFIDNVYLLANFIQHKVSTCRLGNDWFLKYRYSRLQKIVLLSTFSFNYFLIKNLKKFNYYTKIDYQIDYLKICLL